MNSYRYLLFAGADYEASGGWGDCKGQYHCFDYAKLQAKEILRNGFVSDWAHIVDLNTGTIVWDNTNEQT